MQPLRDPEEQMRLLWLCPGDPHQVIALELKIFYRHNAPSYNAISYTWGEPHNQKTVWVDEEAQSVRSTCHYALWQARLHYGGTWIWIDSLCINQDDLAEKSAQVNSMGRTFASAGLVLCCVGCDDDHDIDTIRRIRPDLLGEARGTNEGTYFSSRSCSKEDLKKLQATCRRFCKRPYWERLWVLQEYMLASQKVLLCGQQQVAIALLSNIVQNRHKLLLQSSQNCPQISVFDETFQPVLERGGDTYRLLTALRCTDARDRVYGTLSFYDWTGGRQRLYPDYNRSSFGLAQELLRFVDRFPDAFEIVNMLEINNTDPVLRRLTLDRQNCPLPACNSNSLVNSYSISVESFGRVVEESRETFTGSELAQRELEKTLDLRLLKQEFREATGRGGLEAVKRVRRSLRKQTLYMLLESPDFKGRGRPSVIGLLCPQTQSDDVLMFDDQTDACLVLRPTETPTRHKIIGQGIMFSRVWARPTQIRDADIQITADDLLIFSAQDLSPNRLGSPEVDRTARLERIGTTINGEATVELPAEQQSMLITRHLNIHERAIIGIRGERN